MKKVLISGASGFVGSKLKKLLGDSNQYNLFYLVRRDPVSDNEIKWDPNRGLLDSHKLNDISPDAVINLSGENISGLWTKSKKDKVYDSRIQGNSLLTHQLSLLAKPPSVYINATGVSYYGNDVYQPTDENGKQGTSWFSKVAIDTEKACEALKDKSRIVNVRSGIVLDPSGGALHPMLIPFKFGLGGKLGSGKQYMSWVSLDDITRIYKFALDNEAIKGGVNGTAPNAVTNKEFTKALGEALHRPAIIPVPGFVLNTLLGKEMAGELLLGSQNIYPKKLLDNGFKFNYPTLDQAFDSMFNNNKNK
ncbi:hypothetical protein CYY_002073 [Polysphondylium violaceum]|uniref:TIGR01777 family protein n=1 Tax=Polysphondylium violaceum TaxID=133409 RepID=A0A8J4Q280_9MYCE|nr:hypothetical protein CYY_002073 [Polysphondylium violaceum]